MKVRITFLLKYIVSWIIILMLFKLLFILYYLDKFQGIRFIDFILIFVHGMKLDLSLTAYLVVFPILLFILLFWIRNHLEFKIIKIYTAVILMLITILYVIDLVLYNFWQYRLDYTAFQYVDTPSEMLANLRWYHFFVLAGALIVSYLICCKILFNKLIESTEKFPGRGGWLTAVVFLFILAGLSLPIRGGFGSSTLNVGSAYFHNDIIVNHAAINPVWNLVYSLTEKNEMEYKMEFFDKETETELLKDLQQSETESRKILKLDKPNLIFIILESFTAYIVDSAAKEKGIAPNFNRLIGDGLYFENFYATGDASAKGLGAIFSGYPALPNTYILKFENKVQSIPGICRDLSRLGYTNRFFYGGDINFAHINSYLVHNRFDEIVSIKDFPVSDRLSNWGVPDHIVFNRLYSKTNQAQSPFCHVIFSLSSHAPYDVPMETVIRGSSRDNRFFNSIHYTDKALGEFIGKAELQPWWDSTLVLVMADHGNVYADVTNHDFRKYHIPLLLLGGALNVTDTVIRKFGSQVDIAATLLGQMGLNTSAYKFSRDLLREDSLSYTYYNYHEGIGYLDDSCRIVFDLTSMQFIDEQGQCNRTKCNRVKAILQNMWDDFANR